MMQLPSVGTQFSDVLGGSSTHQPGLFPNPKYEQYLRNEMVPFLRTKGYTDARIRQEYLQGELRLLPEQINALLPEAQTGTPADAPLDPRSTYFGVTPGGPAGAMGTTLQMGNGPVPNNPAAAATQIHGGLASAARGYTMGATDLIPGLKQSARDFQASDPGSALALEVGGGMASPVARGFTALKSLAEMGGMGRVARMFGVLAETAQPTKGLTGYAKLPIVGREATGAFGQALQAGVRGAKQGALYGGVYGTFTGEGNLGDRALQTGANALVGGVLGAPLGVAGYTAQRHQATKAARAAGVPSPQVQEFVTKAFEIDRGALPTLTDFNPGDRIIDHGDAQVWGLFFQGAQASPKGYKAARAWAQERLATNGRLMRGVAMDLAGLAPKGKTLAPAQVVMRELSAQAQREGGPLYRAMNTANPTAPGSAQLDDLMSSPTMQRLVGDKAFAAERASADKARQHLGQLPRGEVQTSLAGDPREAALAARLGRPLTPADRKAFGLAEPKDVDWRTLNNLKIRLDDMIEGVTTGRSSFDDIALADLKAQRSSLLNLMDTAWPNYAAMRAKYSEPLNQKEAFERGLKAARANAGAVEADLADPDLLVLGADAVRYYRLGVLSELETQAGKAANHAMETGGFWTPHRTAMLKLVADPAKHTTIDDYLEVIKRQNDAIAAVPDKPQLAALTQETYEARSAMEEIGGSFGLGQSWLGIRKAVTALGRVGRRMSPETGEEIVKMLLATPTDQTLRVLKPTPLIGAKRASKAGALLGATVMDRADIP